MADLIRVSLMGAMPSGEEWSVNPCYMLFGGAVVTDAEAQAAAVAIAAITWPSSLRASNVPGVNMSSVRVEARTEAGVLQSLGEAARSTPSAGNGSTGHPFQTALVSSLRTQHAGASGRGRLYWPATSANINAADLRLNSASQAELVAEIASYLEGIKDAIATAIGADAWLAVWSRKNNTCYSVNRIEVGNVLDTQRRRRDTLVESYLSAAVVP